MLELAVSKFKAGQVPKNKNPERGKQ